MLKTVPDEHAEAWAAEISRICSGINDHRRDVDTSTLDRLLKALLILPQLLLRGAKRGGRRLITNTRKRFALIQAHDYLALVDE